MISWSRIAVVIKFAALAATHHLEPSGLGNKRVALAAEITTFEAALDSAKLRSKNARTGPRTVDTVRAGQLPAACTTGRAVAGGPSSARSISSKVRPLGSGPNTQKPIRPTTLHEAK
jgi:hypothetical protein